MVWEAARHLARRHQVSVVCGVADPLPPGATMVEVPGAPFRDLLGLWRFRRSAGPALDRLQADVTVSFGVGCPTADVLVVGSVHRAWVAIGGPGYLGPLRLPGQARYLLPRHELRLVLEHTSVRSTVRSPRGRLVAVSQMVADDLVRFYRAPRQAIDIIPNGFDPEQCSPERSRLLRDQERTRLGIDEQEVMLLFVANEYRRKGLDVLLRAMADPSVSARRPRLVLVGRMAPAAFEHTIGRLGLSSQVQWAGATSDVGRYYAAADLFVLPTRYEAFGSVVIEALASGTPVLTSRSAGAATAVRPGHNGLLLEDPTSVVELAGLLDQALGPGVLARWAPACRPSVEGFQWAAVMDRLERVLLEVAGRP